MNNFKTTVVKTTNLTDSVKTVLHISKNDEKEMKAEEVKQLTDLILKRAPAGSKLMIRGLNPMHWNTLGKHQWITLKNMSDELNFQDEEEYYRGEVKETAKFMRFSQIQVVLIKPT